MRSVRGVALFTVVILAMSVSSPFGNAAGSDPVTVLISHGRDGAADSDSFAARLSSNGRFVAFASAASNLVSGDTNEAIDVFVADRLAGSIERVSIASDGSQAEAWVPGEPNLKLPSRNDEQSISADGRYVAFTSNAHNLAADDNKDVVDVFVHDRESGETILASAAADGTPGNGESRSPSLSANGRYVAFETRASNLVPGDSNAAPDVVVKDLSTGAVDRISLGYYGNELPLGAEGPAAISADGRFVTYVTPEPVYTTDGNGETDLYVRDRQENISIAVSVDAFGNFNGDSEDFKPVEMSPDGTLVMFVSSRRLARMDGNQFPDVYVRDLVTGENHLGSKHATDRHLPFGASWGSMSDDGRFVAFETVDPAHPADTNDVADVYVLDRQDGTVARASVSLGNGDADGESRLPALSGDGSAIAFQSAAGNLTDDEPSLNTEIFARGPALEPLPDPPVITAPADGTVVRTDVVTVEGTAPAGLTVRILDGDEPAADVPVDAAGAWSTPLTLAEGEHALRALTIDASGASTPSTPVTVVVDLAAGVPVIDLPAQNASVGSDVVFAGTAGAGDAVSILSAGAPIATATADDAGAWTAGASLADGTHQVVAEAVDPLGRVNVSGTRTFTVDATAPLSPVIVTPAENETVLERPVAVSGTAEPGVTVRVWSGSTVRATVVSDGDGIWTADMDLPTGAYSITADARDVAGNLSAPSDARAFTVDLDQQAPTVVIDTNPSTPVLAVAGQQVIGTAADDRGVARVDVWFSSTVAGGDVMTMVPADCACPGTDIAWAASVPDLAPGRYRVTARAFDTSGNRSNPTSVVLIIA